MTNEAKATELVSGYGRCCKEECRLVALKMAEWKDQQFKEYLEKKRDELQEISNKDFYDMSNAFGGYKYVSEIIKELFKEE